MTELHLYVGHTIVLQKVSAVTLWQGETYLGCGYCSVLDEEFQVRTDAFIGDSLVAGKEHYRVAPEYHKDFYIIVQDADAAQTVRGE